MSRRIKVLGIVLAMLFVKSFSVSATEDTNPNILGLQVVDNLYVVKELDALETTIESLVKENPDIWDEQLQKAVMDGLNNYCLSREGLVKFLNNKKFEKAQVEEAVEGLESKNPNIWNEQAKKSAEKFLNERTYTSAMLLRKFLVEALFEECQIKEAIKGLEQENANIWIDQAKVVAREYLDSGHFSREALIKELVDVCWFEKDQVEEVIKGLEQENANIWNEQAKKAAEYYLGKFTFNEAKELIYQLKFDKFTDEQVNQAVDNFFNNSNE